MIFSGPRRGVLSRRSAPARGPIVLSLLTCLLAWTPALPSWAGVRAQEAEGIIGVVDAFHDALVRGDSTAALALLSDDVVILEGGGVETKSEYRSGHLAGDMRFAQAVPAERGPVRVRREGDAAWAWSTSLRQGRMGDREIDSRGAELVVLRREEGQWLIEAIHWSSRSR